MFCYQQESPDDIDAITEVIIAAFAALEISNHTEQYIIKVLRAADALILSLTTGSGGRRVGHIVFSPVTISDGSKHWYGLGSIPVLPECQRVGIGKALMHEGLSGLKQLGA